MTRDIIAFKKRKRGTSRQIGNLFPIQEKIDFYLPPEMQIKEIWRGEDIVPVSQRGLIGKGNYIPGTTIKINWGSIHKRTFMTPSKFISMTQDSPLDPEKSRELNKAALRGSFEPPFMVLDSNENVVDYGEEYKARWAIQKGFDYIPVIVLEEPKQPEGEVPHYNRKQMESFESRERNK